MSVRLLRGLLISGEDESDLCLIVADLARREDRLSLARSLSARPQAKAPESSSESGEEASPTSGSEASARKSPTPLRLACDAVTDATLALGAETRGRWFECGDRCATALEDVARVSLSISPRQSLRVAPSPPLKRATPQSGARRAERHKAQAASKHRDGVGVVAVVGSDRCAMAKTRPNRVDTLSVGRAQNFARGRPWAGAAKQARRLARRDDRPPPAVLLLQHADRAYNHGKAFLEANIDDTDVRVYDAVVTYTNVDDACAKALETQLLFTVLSRATKPT